MAYYRYYIMIKIISESCIKKSYKWQYFWESVQWWNLAEKKKTSKCYKWRVFVIIRRYIGAWRLAILSVIGHKLWNIWSIFAKIFVLFFLFKSIIWQSRYSYRSHSYFLPPVKKDLCIIVFFKKWDQIFACCTFFKMPIYSQYLL